MLLKNKNQTFNYLRILKNSLYISKHHTKIFETLYSSFYVSLEAHMQKLISKFKL